MPGDLAVLISYIIAILTMAIYGIFAPDNLGGGLALALSLCLGFLLMVWGIVSVVGWRLG